MTRASGFPIYVNVININIHGNSEETIVNKLAELLGQTRDWLDERGKPAWIAAFVLGFVFIWPVGLAILFYTIWSGRMGCGRGGWGRKHGRSGAGPTGNAAFDEYRADTMKRLEEEQTAFVSFLEKLRQAKDKAEFDQFMADRGRPIDGEATTA